jgi:hypothetical protein
MQTVWKKKLGCLLKSNLAFLLGKGGKLLKLKSLPMLWSGIMIFSSLAFIGIPFAHGAIWYVKTDGSDTNGGTGWEDSFKTIQRGIDEASAGDTVLVEDGIYTGAGNKNIDLGYKNMIVRSVNGPQSCIIDLQNEGKGFNLDWTYSSATQIEGFTIMNGSPASVYDYGVGISCTWCSAIIRNCIIKNNAGVQWGAGIDIRNSPAHPVIVNTVFYNNHSSYNGGAVSIYQASATFINCTFHGNTSYISVIAATPTTDFKNCIFWGNNPSSTFAGLDISYSDVEGGNEGAGNIEMNPEFVDPDNEDFRLSPASFCIDAGRNDAPNIAGKDIFGQQRFIDGNSDGKADVDMGAHEYGDIAECDYDKDLDLDGVDLAEFINDSADYTIADLAEDFGRVNCPYYIQ